VVRALRARGHEVVALTGADQGLENLAGLDVEVRPFDLLDPASVREALAGGGALFHTAAVYAFWDRDPERLYRVNVAGTRAVLEAAREHRFERVVYTSSTATLTPAWGDACGDEDDIFDPRRFQGHYKTSKLMAEIVALREAARGLPLVVVHPTTVVGPGDRRPTPTGSLLVHFLNGRMKAYVDTVLNVVDVDDVAEGHVLAWERGGPGERYILGGEDLTMREVVDVLGELTGIPAPRVRIPGAVLAAAGRAGEWLADHVTHRAPIVERESTLHARSNRPFCAAKARKELGFRPLPARVALARALAWFLAEGRASPRCARVVAAHGALRETLAAADRIPEV
jgi:dihydroflavonol-4-reductase